MNSIFFVHPNLIISRVCIKETLSFIASCCVDELVYLREREAVLRAIFIEIGEINTDPPFAILLLDHHYILSYAPQHNWSADEEALKTNPVLAKMMISGVVYSLGDWIAQCFEGKPLFEFDRARMFKSGLVGFTLHGSLSHYYWWVVPAKVIFDQTAWAAVWNSVYYIVLGFLLFESPFSIFSEMKATFWPMLTAGWKLWPFAHLITYGVVPVEQMLLWVDCVELIWVTILSTYSNEKSEARISDAPVEANSGASNTNSHEVYLV
ncbi:hypothetical protein UlMin_003212 [Ulmus minor]